MFVRRGDEAGKGNQREERSGETSETGIRGQRSEVGGQREASQMVNLSTSQMVMNGFSDALTV